MSNKTDPDIPTAELGLYRHNKSGDIYEVVGTAAHSETHEPLVVYRPTYESKYQLFARPYEMFVDTVELNGEKKPRFEKLED